MPVGSGSTNRGNLDKGDTLRYCPAQHVIQVETQMPTARYMPSSVAQNSFFPRLLALYQRSIFHRRLAVSIAHPRWRQLQGCGLTAALLIVAALALSPAANADDWMPISPEELKMTAEPKAPGAPAVYLYRQVDRSDLSRGGHEINYIQIKILTEAGRDYANIEIPYRDKMFISNIHARTVRPDGSIANFDGQVFKTTL